MTIFNDPMTPADWLAVSGLPLLAYGLWLAWQTRHIDLDEKKPDDKAKHPAE
jgi:hypothetical protein